MSGPVLYICIRVYQVRSTGTHDTPVLRGGTPEYTTRIWYQLWTISQHTQNAHSSIMNIDHLRYYGTQIVLRVYLCRTRARQPQNCNYLFCCAVRVHQYWIGYSGSQSIRLTCCCIVVCLYLAYIRKTFVRTLVRTEVNSSTYLFSCMIGSKLSLCCKYSTFVIQHLLRYVTAQRFWRSAPGRRYCVYGTLWSERHYFCTALSGWCLRWIISYFPFYSHGVCCALRTRHPQRRPYPPLPVGHGVIWTCRAVYICTMPR